MTSPSNPSHPKTRGPTHSHAPRNLRAQAIDSLHRVVQGRSLSTVLPAAQTHTAERDRARDLLTRQPIARAAADGRQEQRIWTITRSAEGRWTGRAADVVGEAEGRSAGNALNWTYTLSLPVDGKVYEVQFDDWMYLVDERVMINKAVMSKFGVTLGEVTLSFRKP